GDGEDRQLPKRQAVEHLVRRVDVRGHPGPDGLLLAAVAAHRVTARRPGMRSPRVICCTTTTRTTAPSMLPLRPPEVANLRISPGTLTVVHSRTMTTNMLITPPGSIGRP